MGRYLSLDFIKFGGEVLFVEIGICLVLYWVN